MRHYDAIHPTATIGDGVVLGEGVRIGPGAVVYDNVSIGAGSSIGANVVLGEPHAEAYRDRGYRNPPLTIGAGAVIRAGSILYAGSTFGDRFETGHRATIREGTMVGSHSRVGTGSDLMGRCRIGDYVRIHSSVVISQDVVIGDFVWIFPYTVLSDCPYPPSDESSPVVIEDFAVLAANVLVLPGVRIGRDAFVAGASVVTRDVPGETYVRGHPARAIGSVRDIRSPKSGRPMYPWRDHFERGMPWEGIGYAAWRAAADAAAGTGIAR